MIQQLGLRAPGPTRLDWAYHWSVCAFRHGIGAPCVARSWVSSDRGARGLRICGLPLRSYDADSWSPTARGLPAIADLVRVKAGGSLR